MDSNNHLSENFESLDSIIDKLNETIYNGELTEIIEVTYAYEKMPDGTYWNKTIFTEFGGLELSEDTGNLGFIDNKIQYLTNQSHQIKDKLKEKIELIEDFLGNIKGLTNLSEQDQIRKDFLVGSLLYVSNTIEMAYYGLPFELEKAGLAHGLSDYEVESRVSIIEDLERVNFGGKISNNPEEVGLCYNYLLERYEEGYHKLSIDEQKEYDLFLSEIKALIPNHEYIKEQKQEPDNRFEKILRTKIPREKYISILAQAFSLLGLDIDIVEEERDSIYDGEGTLYIPLDKKYNSLTIKRIRELIGHEIESHYINMDINSKLLGNFRGFGNLEKEEGLAMTMEALLNGTKLEDIGIPQHFPKVLSAELFSGARLERFLQLDNIISPDIGHNGRKTRLKRNYPINYTGGQHKDATYGRGVLKTVKFLKDGKDIRELYLGKISFNDIPKARKLLELSGKTIDDIDLPLFIGELITYLLGIEYNEVNIEDFFDILKEKYPFIDFSQMKISLTQKDIETKVMDLVGNLDEILIDNIVSKTTERESRRLIH